MKDLVASAVSYKFLFSIKSRYLQNLEIHITHSALIQVTDIVYYRSGNEVAPEEILVVHQLKLL